MIQDNEFLKQPARVLIYCSDGDSRHQIEAALLSLGHRVVSAGTVEETLEIVKESDVVFMRGNPLLSDCIEIVGRIKSTRDSRIIPVILVASASTTEERLKAVEAGIDDFVTFPLDTVELRVTIANQLKLVFYARQLLNYNKEVEAEVTRRTESLRESFKNMKVVSLDTIYRLSRAAEFRDEDIAHGHIERMSHYSTSIARRLGMDEAFLQNILFAAPLHDIGKIAIPDRVLRKPGRLDDDEWKLVVQHTPFGADILKSSETDFLQMAHTIAATHHEKWDGTGYPLGLKGDQIPLAGRIVAVADVFDVLTWERPYKQPLPLETAFTIIREGKGTHFDPGVVDAFFIIQDEIIGEFNWWKFMA